MSSILGKLKVDGHKAAILLDGEVVAKCASKAIAVEMATKVNNYDKQAAQIKQLREALQDTDAQCRRFLKISDTSITIASQALEATKE